MNTQTKFDDLAASLPPLTPAPGTCLTCGEPMTLQDHAGDTWWCPGCRLFANSLGKPLPLPTIRRRPSQAQELLNDLQAAGCGIHLDGDELRITNLTKLSTALWARLDNAGPDFVQLARRSAEIWQNCDANPWTN